VTGYLVAEEMLEAAQVGGQAVGESITSTWLRSK
jgi:hypothetical protein